MPDKRLSNIMLEKLKKKPDYFASYLSQYQLNENLSLKDLAKLLEALPEQLEALSMCKAPDSRQPGFVKHLTLVADFAGVNHFKLAMLIRRVEAARALHIDSISDIPSLIAAREKENTSRESSNQDEITDTQ